MKKIIRKMVIIVKKLMHELKLIFNPVIIEDGDITVKGATLREARQKLANELVKKHNVERVILHCADGDVISE